MGLFGKSKEKKERVLFKEWRRIYESAQNRGESKGSASDYADDEMHSRHGLEVKDMSKIAVKGWLKKWGGPSRFDKD